MVDSWHGVRVEQWEQETTVTYVVPFCVSSTGLLVGTRRPAEPAE